MKILELEFKLREQENSKAKSDGETEVLDSLSLVSRYNQMDKLSANIDEWLKLSATTNGWISCL